MGKRDVGYSPELETLRNQLKELEEKQEILLAFSNKLIEKKDEFNDEMLRRKNRLCVVNNIEHMNVAKGYYDVMFEELYGEKSINVYNAIDSMGGKIDAFSGNLEIEITEIEKKIAELEASISKTNEEDEKGGWL